MFRAVFVYPTKNTTEKKFSVWLDSVGRICYSEQKGAKKKKQNYDSIVFTPR